ncbi:MAG: hypothetical protein WBR29_12720 [Gammaproteobacteria bacterium]
MKAIVRTCWEICLLRQGPQIFPRSWLLFAVMLVVYILVDAILFAAQGIRDYQIVYQTLFDCALLVAFLALVLMLWQKFERFNQTAVALFGSGALIMIAAVPVSFVATMPDSTSVQIMVEVLIYAILAWSILVIAHVIRHALDTKLFIGIFLAGAYTVINILLFALLFPIKG